MLLFILKKKKKDILINPEAVESQGLTGLQESTSKASAARIYKEHLQLNKKVNPVRKLAKDNTQKKIYKWSTST